MRARHSRRNLIEPPSVRILTKANNRRLSTNNLLPLDAASEDDHVMVIVLAAAVSLTLAGLLSRLCLAGLLWALVAANRRQSRLDGTERDVTRTATRHR